MKRYAWRPYRLLPWYWKLAVRLTDRPFFVGTPLRKWIRRHQGWST